MSVVARLTSSHLRRCVLGRTRIFGGPGYESRWGRTAPGKQSARRESGLRPRYANGVGGSQLVVRFLAGSAQFFPHVIGMRRPLRVLETGDLQFVFPERAMAVGANVLDSRAAELK